MEPGARVAADGRADRSLEIPTKSQLAVLQFRQFVDDLQLVSIDLDQVTAGKDCLRLLKAGGRRCEADHPGIEKALSDIDFPIAGWKDWC